jgi:hypothetical protein
MKTLKSAIENLQHIFKPKTVPYAKMYLALLELEEKACPRAPDESQESWDKSFIERYGTLEEFVEKNMRKKKGGINGEK